MPYRLERVFLAFLGFLAPPSLLRAPRMPGEEVVLWSGRGRLFRLVPGAWPVWTAERLGRGSAQLVEDGMTDRILFEFRTPGGFVYAHHYPSEGHVLHPAPCPLPRFAGKCWTWTAYDAAFLPASPVKDFALLFPSAALAADFRAAFEGARFENGRRAAREALQQETTAGAL